jgi:hypothetical protein
MSLPKNRPFNIIRVSTYMADSSTAGSAFTVAPCRGKIVKMGSVIHAAVTTADTAITSKVAGTSITGGAWTIAFTGAAAGDEDTAIPTAANTVNEDDNIEFVSDGAGSGTVPTTFFADILVD